MARDMARFHLDERRLARNVALRFRKIVGFCGIVIAGTVF
jgi:hypothetical protein